MSTSSRHGDEDLLEPLPALDGDEEVDEESAEADPDFEWLDAGDDEQVGLDDATSDQDPIDAALLQALPEDMANTALDDLTVGDLVDPSLDLDDPGETSWVDTGRREGDWDDAAEIEHAPPLGDDDGGILGLEEPTLEDARDSDEVDLPPLPGERDEGAADDGTGGGRGSG